VSPRPAAITAIAIGGAAGALLRALVGGAGALATLGVNITGTILLAAIAGLIAWRPDLPHWFHPLAAIGFCGSITTFSTMQVEAVVMMQDGQSAAAVLYLLVSVALGFIAVLATRRVLTRIMA
jgi:CrcB protein